MKFIPLKRGRFATVDNKSYPVLKKHKWHVDGKGYPQTNIKTKDGWKPVRMHVLLVGKNCDHSNGDKLDNRLENLRRCTRIQNSRNRPKQANNTTGYKGVTYNPRRRVYEAYITYRRKHRYLGAFPFALEAAMAYSIAAKDCFGAFAFSNFTSAEIVSRS